MYRKQKDVTYSNRFYCQRRRAMKDKIVKNKEKLFDALSPEDKMKLEIAEELGLLDKVQEGGWKALTAKETGRIGGLMTKKKRELNKQKEEAQQSIDMSVYFTY